MAEITDQLAAFKCSICGKSFEQETSCKRHIRRCPRKQPTPLRQKSCSRCVSCKTRCDLRQPSCSRCSDKNLECIYPASVRTDESAGIAPEHLDWDTISSDIVELSWTSLPMIDGERTITDDAGLTGFGETSLVSSGASFPSTRSSFGVPEIDDLSYRLQRPSSLSPFPFNSENMTLSDPLLQTLPYWPRKQAGSGTPIPASELTPIEDEEIPPKDKLSQIRDRWINPLFQPPSKTLSVHGTSAGFMTHVLKCYPKMMARDGSVPPIIHRLQLMSTTAPVPLVNCLAWTKIWEHRTGNGEAALLYGMQGELDRLYKDHRLYGQTDLLAALQASLIYSIIIYLDSNTTVKYAVPLVLGQLQEMAYHLLITVAFPKARPSGTVPDQESWVITSAAHRTVLAIYVFDCVICFLNRVPVYSCDELDFIPAPVCRQLWEARDYETWREEYVNWLKIWKGGEIVMGELLNRLAESYAYNRVEKWLSEADEFGMLIFTGSLLFAES